MSLKRVIEEALYTIVPGDEGCATYSSDCIFNFLLSFNYFAKEPPSNTAIVQVGFSSF